MTQVFKPIALAALVAALPLSALAATPAKSSGKKAAATAKAAEPATFDASELMKLHQESGDSATAKAAIPRIRRMIAQKPDSIYIGILRLALVRGLMSSGASGPEIAAAADSADIFVPSQAQQQVIFHSSVAIALAERGGADAAAIDHARQGVAAAQATQGFVPPGSTHYVHPLQAFALQCLGTVYLELDLADSAVTALESALRVSPDSANVLYRLGMAYENTGNADRAIDAYVRSLGSFPCRDTLAYEPLRLVYNKKRGSLAGMVEKVQSTCAASTRAVAIEPRRYEKTAPDYSLPSIAGATGSLAAHRGKVVVIDFWGSWCGPCRAELPHFQSAYEKHKGRPVEFIGLNWERADTPEKHMKLAKDFVTANKYTFPVLVDAGGKTVTSYGVESFPTVFIVDQKGMIRFRNVGFSENIADILDAQINSLLQ